MVMLVKEEKLSGCKEYSWSTWLAKFSLWEGARLVLGAGRR